MVAAEHVDPQLHSSHSRVTDSYLLALAGAYGGRLATMDHKLAVDAVAGGATVLQVI
jgi:predicted nucleic acid-binding protein